MNANRKNLITYYFKVFIFLISFTSIKSNFKENTINNTIPNQPYNSFNTNNLKEIIFGNYLEIIFYEKETIEIKIDEILNFSILTYEVIPNYGKINVSIYDENQDFNIIKRNERNIFNSDELNKSGSENFKFYISKKVNDNNSNINNYEGKNINIYKSYFYTYNIKEMTVRKKTLRIKCEQGLLNGNKKICVSKVNFYTENDRININDPNIKDLPLFKYISKGNKNKYFFGNNTNNIYLIELFSGNISIEFDGSNKTISNKRFFNSYNITNLNIYGNEDSFYSIYDYSSKYMINNLFIIDSNYFLNLEPSKEKTIKLLDYYYYYGQNKTSYYFGIYSPEGNISIKLKDPWNQGEKKYEKSNIKQIIMPSNLDYDFILINKGIKNLNNIKVL